MRFAYPTYFGAGSRRSDKRSASDIWNVASLCCENISGKKKPAERAGFFTVFQSLSEAELKVAEHLINFEVRWKTAVSFGVVVVKPNGDFWREEVLRSQPQAV